MTCTQRFDYMAFIEYICVYLQETKDSLFTQSRVQSLTSSELWAVIDLADVSSEAGEYTRTSFYRTLQSHGCTWMCMYAYTVYVGTSSRMGA